ncbi:MAG TPA: hypothetical protein VGK21_03885 [Candidatus Angelobacter sp.]
MKIGAENKNQLRIMIVLLAILLLVGIYNFVDFGASSAAAPATSTQVAQSAKKSGTAQIVDNTLDPRLHVTELVASQNVKYEAGGRNIFKMEEVRIPQMQGPARQIAEIGPPVPPTPTPTPPPPPIPLKFYGFASKPTEPKRIFLDDEGEVFVARQGDIVERKYKVIQINNTSVIIEDVLYNNRQTIQLTAK